MGTIADHWVGRKHWPEHCKAPYLVLVDDGMAIYCRRTDKDFIKPTNVPPMEVVFRVGARVECKLEADDDTWFAGTVLQREVDWSYSPLETPPYLIRFDYGVSCQCGCYYVHNVTSWSLNPSILYCVIFF